MVAYKILLFLSCSDLFGMFTNSFVSGILFLQGAVYCNYPQLFYIWGSFTMGNLVSQRQIKESRLVGWRVVGASCWV